MQDSSTKPPKWQRELGPLLRPLQLTAGTLIVGSVVAMVVVLARSRVAHGWPPHAMTYAAFAMGAVALIARAIVGHQMVERGRRSIFEGTWRPIGQQPAKQTEFRRRHGDAGNLVALYSTARILAWALLEGVIIFLLMAYLLEQVLLSLIVAVVLILRLAYEFPTRARLVYWVDDQLEELGRMRQFDK